METHKFTSDIFWVGISQLIVNLLGIITLPALTKNYSTELYGVWTQINVTVGLLTPVLTLHFSTAVVRFLAGESDEKRFRQIYAPMVWASIIFIIGVVFLSLVLKSNLSSIIFGNSKYASFVPLTFIWTGTASFFPLLLAYLRARGKIKKISLYNLYYSLIRVFLLVLLAKLGYPLKWIIISQIFVEILLICILTRQIVNEIGFLSPCFSNLKRYLIFSLPQIPNGILLWVINASDRYFIIHYLNLSQAGIYSASYSLGSLIALFYSPISYVLYPTISKYWQQNKIIKVKNYLEYSIKMFLVLAIPGAVGLYILANPLLHSLATSEYAIGGGLTLLVAVGTILLGIYQMNVHVILLVQQTKWLPIITGTSALINIIINIILIPQIGIVGAAISTIISYFILAVIVTLWARITADYSFDSVFLFKCIASSLLMVACLRFMPINNIFHIVLAVIAGVIIYIVGLLVLRTFSKTDKVLIYETLSATIKSLSFKKKGGFNITGNGK